MEDSGANLRAKEIVLLCIPVLALFYWLCAKEVGWWPYTPSQVHARAAAEAEHITGLPASAADDLVATFKSSGLLRREDPPRFWVDPLLWARLDAAQRERVCISLASYCIARNIDTTVVSVFDSMSGKRLANYGRYSGFETF